MKIVIIANLLFLSFTSNSQIKIVGQYRDYFGNRILLNPDSTFKFSWRFDLAASWTKGIWSIKNDTILFHMIPIYDTLSIIDSNMKSVDTLVLSADETSERVNTAQNMKNVLQSGGQNRVAYPGKLLFRKGKLYKIQNGRLVTNKQKSAWTSKEWNPWYFKIDN